MDKTALINCFQDTLNMCNSSKLYSATEKARESTKVYKENFNSKKTHSYLTQEGISLSENFAEIIVKEGTSLAAAKEYIKFGKTAVLNFANPHNAGGGVQNGAMAQEECLCRSSNLYPCLLTKKAQAEYYDYNKNNTDYSFSDRIIYSEGVTVFKNDNEVPCLMPEQEWFEVSVITCSAPYIAKRKYTNKAALEELFKKRIKNIFEAALDNDIKVLVLGAFGCGAFQNPPEIVAVAFREVIEENEYKHYFNKIIFAIKSTVNNDSFAACPNIAAFEMAFDGIPVELCELRFSAPWSFEQAAGVVEMPSGRLLKGGAELDDYFKWRGKNKYNGKQFSILGDSISTLEGFNPKGYNVFYKDENCDKSNIHTMKDTWWGKVIDFFGGKLLVNNSWSGSRVTKLSDSNQLFPSACSDERTAGLHIGNVTPDVIMIYLGTNDWCFGTDRKNKGNQKNELECFDIAYDRMLAGIKSNYPNAEIWCFLLSSTFMSDNPSFVFPKIYNENNITDYNRIISDTAEKQKCKLINLWFDEIPYDSVDGTHPNLNGMRTLATKIIRCIDGYERTEENTRPFWVKSDIYGYECKYSEINRFMDCGKDEHELVLTKQSGDYDFCYCKKCGKYFRDLSLLPVNYTQKEWEELSSLLENKLDYVTLSDNITRILYDNRLSLYSEWQNNKISLEGPILILGREYDCDIVLNNNTVSRIHAVFYFENSTWYIADFSQNGTWLNGSRMKPKTKYELFANDLIHIAGIENMVFYKTSDNFSTNSNFNNSGRIDEISKLSKIIDNKYKIFKQIKEGPYIKTYLVQNLNLNTLCLLKMCYKNRMDNINFLMLETNMIKNLHHHMIPKIIDIVDDNEYFGIVEEYFEGENLNNVIKKYGPQSLENVIYWARQICDVLQYLHTLTPPRIHRDIKPANMILQSDGQVKLIDFGTMILYHSDQSGDAVIGTRGYAPPEQYSGQVDARTDIFALGMTMHYLLTGINPIKNYEAVTAIRQINPKFPVRLEKIINKCTELNAAKRFQSCLELLEALNKINISKEGILSKILKKR